MHRPQPNLNSGFWFLWTCSQNFVCAPKSPLVILENSTNFLQIKKKKKKSFSAPTLSLSAGMTAYKSIKNAASWSFYFFLIWMSSRVLLLYKFSSHLISDLNSINHFVIWLNWPFNFPFFLNPSVKRHKHWNIFLVGQTLFL